MRVSLEYDRWGADGLKRVKIYSIIGNEMQAGEKPKQSLYW